jgi:hypothetical protein
MSSNEKEREYEEGVAGTDVKRKDESTKKLVKEPLEGDKDQEIEGYRDKEINR